MTPFQGQVMAIWRKSWAAKSAAAVLYYVWVND
jgi:hypothetical protein